MKRKFVKVMLFGALTLAVSTTVTSCKDYDDDVKNLQEQIDKINSSSPVSIEDMKTAIAAAKTELATEIDKLSKALDNKEASIKALETEIETLKGKLNDAQGDADAAKKLATELSTKQNELKKLVDANDETLKELKASYDRLTGTEGDIQKLQQFVADYENNNVISENAKSDELLAAFINSTIAEKLEGKELVEYINTAVSTAIGQELASVNNSITAITGKDGSLTKLQAEFDAAMNGDEKNKGIIDRLDELDETKDAINTFLEKNPGQYADFAAVLNQIETLRSNYETMFTPSSLQGKVEQAINAALETTDFTFKQLVENVKQMGLDIEAIKAMVQSVVYVPKNTAGTEEFTTLYAKKNTQASFDIISRSEDLTVTFRVSPAKAALGFETGKYSLLMDAQEINTRSTSIFGVGEVAVDKKDGEPTGIITIPLIATAASKDYALCLMVKDNSKEVFTEVTSSYFPVLMTTKYLSPSYKVKYVSGETGRDIVYNETTNEPLTFSKEGKVQAVFYDDETTADADASTSYVDVPTGLKGVFNTTFALEGDNKGYFDINPTTGAVTLNSTAFGQVGLVGQQIDVNAVTKITGVDEPVTTGLTATGGKVTITQKTENKEIAYSFEGTWIGNDEQTYTINMVDLYNKGAITEADYKALAASAFDVTGADNNVTFVRATDGTNALTITVPSATKVGTYNPKAVITVSSVKKITVKAAITVKSLADVALTTVASPQKVDAGVDAAQATEIAVEVGDVSTLFPNYSDVYKKVVTEAGGTIEFAVTGTGADFSNNPKLTITKDYAAPVKVTATVKCGEKKDAVYTVTLVPDAKLSGTWTAPTKLTQKIASDKASTVNLATGSVWKDYRSQKMWEAGTAVTGNGTNGFANSVVALGMYGLEAPAFKVVGDNADKFEVSAAGVLSYSQVGKNMPSRDGLTATVTVTVKSKWGGAISSTGDVTTIKVTVE